MAMRWGLGGADGCLGVTTLEAVHGDWGVAFRGDETGVMGRRGR